MLKALVYLMVFGTLLSLVAGLVVIVGGAALVVGLVAGTVSVVRAVRQRRADAALAAERAEQELLHRAEAEDARFRSGDVRGIFGQFPPVDGTGHSLYARVETTAVPVRRDPSIDAAAVRARRDANIEAAIARSSTPAAFKKRTRGLEKHLQAGEQVTALAICLYAAKSGVLVLTDRRLLFLVKGAVVEDVSLRRVTDIDWRPKLVFGFLTVRHDGTETIFDCQKADAEPIVGLLRAQVRRTPSRTVATRSARHDRDMRRDRRTVVDDVGDSALDDDDVPAPIKKLTPTPIRKRTPPPPNVAPGWYPNHPGAPMQRYWDGDGWSEHTAPLPPQ